MKAILLIVTSSLISSVGLSQNTQNEEAVRKVVVAFQDDFNDGAFENAANYTTADWEHLNPMGGITRGRDEVLKAVKSAHLTFLKGVTMTVESMNIRFVTSDVAIANVIHKINPYESADGVKHENERRLKAYVIVKQNGQWLLTHDQNTIVNVR